MGTRSPLVGQGAALERLVLTCPVVSGLFNVGQLQFSDELCGSQSLKTVGIKNQRIFLVIILVLYLAGCQGPQVRRWHEQTETVSRVGCRGR